MLGDPKHIYTAVGHMASADDEYDGFFIPKGTVVMGNAWYVEGNTCSIRHLNAVPQGYLARSSCLFRAFGISTGAISEGWSTRSRCQEP